MKVTFRMGDEYVELEMLTTTYDDVTYGAKLVKFWLFGQEVVAVAICVGDARIINPPGAAVAWLVGQGLEVDLAGRLVDQALNQGQLVL